jgi:phospholipid/cholesterol/gamma-HCH transport system ATP-binding protein
MAMLEKAPQKDVVIKVRDLVVGFRDQNILNHLDLDVYRGEILGFVGGSGAGKSVLTRTIIGLLPRREGSIEVFGTDMLKANEEERRAIERRWGILFQQGALFSSLTVRENIQFPIREYLHLPERLLDEIVVAKLEMVGLHANVRDKYPSELSGGMTKRVALARALALDPEIFMVTHDLDSLHTVCDRIAVLIDGKVIAAGPMETMLASEHPWMKSYFHGARSRAEARPARSGLNR